MEEGVVEVGRGRLGRGEGVALGQIAGVAGVALGIVMHVSTDSLVRRPVSDREV